MKLGTLLFQSFVILSLYSPSYAVDFGPPQKVNETFNTLAKAMKWSSRMVLQRCEGSPPATCMFGLSGKITVLAIADAKTPDKSQLVVFGADRSSDPKAFVQTVQVAMGAFARTTDVQEIRAAYDILFAPPLKDFRETQINGVKYVLKAIDGGGLFFTISDPNIPK